MPLIVAIIPTYNEPEYLQRCLESLESQGLPIHLVIVNAGDPLPFSVGANAQVVEVGSECYWTACVQKGLDLARSLHADLVLLSNADTVFLPGTVQALLSTVSLESRKIACSPAYCRNTMGDLGLQYHGQSSWGFLLYGKLLRGWNRTEESPPEEIRVDLTGGQGVLIPIQAFDGIEMDTKRFPQYASDHDLWLMMAKRGWSLWVAPAAGIVNERTFNRNRRGSLLGTLFWRMRSEFAPESIPIMWRLRSKHLTIPIAVFSFLISFALRWTLGLPNIIKRS
ncbi:MAG: glycosyltransferase family 2 protein [Armatimonadetes bacterium]|nr:glycosyltransferase family 2 protein [Armatimonadota bacterium]